MGQTDKKKLFFYFWSIFFISVEVNFAYSFRLQVTKQSLSARVVDEQQIERHFSMNELAELYEYKDEPIVSLPYSLSSTNSELLKLPVCIVVKWNLSYQINKADYNELGC